MGFYAKHRWFRVIIGIISGIIIIVLIAVAFMRIFPAFGGRPTKAERKNYSQRAGYYDGRRFNYPDEWSIEGIGQDVRVSSKGTAPKDELPVKFPEIDEDTDINDVRVTWFGHSFVLIQMHRMNILVDPVFSQRSSPVQWIGPKRFTVPSVSAADLPHIDVLLISHDHHDHLDPDTIREIDSKVDRYIVPLGIENHLERWGVSPDKILNKAWWESETVNGLEITCTPGRHFSGRSLIDQNYTQWCSWVLMDEYHQIFENGDGGFGGHFEEIHDRFGDFDLVMLDCAQYDANWHYSHMYPEESAMAAEILGAKVVMPIHWGAFILSSHSWDDPPERFTIAAEQRGLNIVTPYLCETMDPDAHDKYQERWWRNYE